MNILGSRVVIVGVVTFLTGLVIGVTIDQYATGQQVKADQASLSHVTK